MSNSKFILKLKFLKFITKAIIYKKLMKLQI